MVYQKGVPMFRRATLLACLFGLLAATAAAQTDYIGLFADPEGTVCAADLAPDQTATLYVLAILPNLGEGGVTATEFRVAGLPPMGAGGAWTAEWNSELTIGNPETGIAIAFTPPLYGEVVEFGRIHLTPLAADWVGPDHVISIEQSYPPHPTLVIVDDTFEEQNVGGGWFTCNCTAPDGCPCEEPSCRIAPPTLDFGPVAQGDHALQSFTITNRGLTTIVGDLSEDSPHFAIIGGGGPFELDYWESLTVTIRFEPQTEGYLGAWIDTGTGVCDDVYVEGQGMLSCYVEPATSFDLGAVPIGTYAEEQFYLHNPEYNGTSIYGYVTEDCEELRVAHGAAYDIPPGANHLVRVRYAPLSEGPFLCEVDTDNPDCGKVIFTGEGYYSGDVPQLETDHIGLYMETNASDCDEPLSVNHYLIIQIVAVLPSLPAEPITGATFRVAGLQTNSVSNMEWPGATATGDLDEGLTLVFDEPRSGLILPLGWFSVFRQYSSWFPEGTVLTVARTFAGEGVAVFDLDGAPVTTAGGSFTVNCPAGEECPCADFSAPVCAMVPDDLEFGHVTVGDFADRDLTVMNHGGSVLTGDLATNGAAFEIVAGGGPFTLAPGEDLVATVRFAPPSYGSQTGYVSTDCLPCGEVACHGFGDSPPVCEVTPPELAFGDVSVGGYADRTFTVANAGGGTLSGTVALDDPDFTILFGAGPFALQPGVQHEVTVRFTPPAMGLFEAAVDLGTEDCPAVPCQGRGAPYEDYGNHIGLFADAAGTVCEAPLAAGETDTLYVLAVLPDFTDPGIVAATLRVDGLPGQGTGGHYWAEWEGTADGDLTGGVTVSFDSPQAGGFVTLGRVMFEAWEEGWLTVDHLLQVAGPGAEDDPLVTDPQAGDWEVFGGHFTFNCGVPGTCDCADFASPVCDLDPASIHFGAVQVDGWSDRTFAIVNTGYGTMAGDLSVTGEGFSLVVGAGPFALQHGETLSGTVRFLPTAVTDYAGAVLTGLDDCPELPLDGTGVSGGYDDNFIGVFAETTGETCYADAPPYQMVTLHVMAYVPSYAGVGITAVEFRIDDLPENLGYPYGLITPTWDSPLVIGDPWYGIAIAFAQPQYGVFVHLGTLEIMSFSEDWIGEDQEMRVEASYSSGYLVVVDANYEEHWIMGGQFTFNCSDPYYCTCLPYLVPVAVSLFDLEAGPGAVTARWESASTGADFRLEAAAADGATWEVPWTETAPGAYAARDASPRLAAGGVFTYTLQGRTGDGDWELLRSRQLDVAPAPRPTRLAAPHPNPFNPSVTVPFSLSAPQHLRLAVFDVAGRLVRTLHDGPAAAGESSLIWDGRDDAGRPAGTGVYFVRMQSAGFRASRKLVLLR